MNHDSIPLDEVTGLVLAGGRGSRMGGIDKGLVAYQGRALVAWALERLAPQVGTLAINANRSLDAYAAFGVPLWTDSVAGQPGPLAGMLAGLEQARTPYLACVPCDSPQLPTDLVARLGAAMRQASTPVAMAVSCDEHGAWQAEPVCCLLSTALAPTLREALLGGARRVERWAQAVGCTPVRFDDRSAFANVNTLDDLHQPRRS